MSQKVIEQYATKEVQSLPIMPIGGEKIDEKKEKWLRDWVVVEFKNLEEPRANQEFCYGSTKNKCKFNLWPGGVYKIPRFIQRHLETLGTPLWNWVPDGSGRMRKEKQSYKSRFQLREVYA